MEVVCANKLCNKTFIFKGGPAHFARAKHHFCCRPCQNTIHGLSGTQRHKIWERTKKRAKENGDVFMLSLTDIPEIPKYCPVLGVELKANVVAGPLDSSPSIDRIVAAHGYVPNNIRIISNRANRLRSDATAEELRRVADDAEVLARKNA
jgi:hypothetical protein